MFSVKSIFFIKSCGFWLSAFFVQTWYIPASPAWKSDWSMLLDLVKIKSIRQSDSWILQQLHRYFLCWTQPLFRFLSKKKKRKKEKRKTQVDWLWVQFIFFDWSICKILPSNWLIECFEAFIASNGRDLWCPLLITRKGLWTRNKALRKRKALFAFFTSGRQHSCDASQYCLMHSNMQFNIDIINIDELLSCRRKESLIKKIIENRWTDIYQAITNGKLKNFFLSFLLFQSFPF